MLQVDRFGPGKLRSVSTTFGDVREALQMRPIGGVAQAHVRVATVVL
jgi:hypothetical protein